MYVSSATHTFQDTLFPITLFARYHASLAARFDAESAEWPSAADIPSESYILTDQRLHVVSVVPVVNNTPSEKWWRPKGGGVLAVHQRTVSQPCVRRVRQDTVCAWAIWSCRKVHLAETSPWTGGCGRAREMVPTHCRRLHLREETSLRPSHIP